MRALIIGSVLSGVWLAIIGLYVTQMIGWQSLIELLPHELGGFLADAAAPLAFL